MYSITVGIDYGNSSVQDDISLKEWHTSMRTAHRVSQELLQRMGRKAIKVYCSFTLSITQCDPEFVKIYFVFLFIDVTY